MNRYLSYILFASCLMMVTPAQAGTNTSVFSATYPSTQGNYSNLTINSLLSVNSSLEFSGTGASPTCTTGGGVAYLVNNGHGVIEVCDHNGSYTLTNTTLWNSPNGANGAYMYPATSSERVSIGSTTDPGTFGANLFVYGLTFMGGSLTMTGEATMSSLIVNSNATFGEGITVNGAPASLNSGATVTGPVTIAGDTTINPTNQVTVNGPVAISGATTIGGATSVTGTTSLNGNTIISNTGTLTVNNGTAITLCTGGANCGTLQVAASTCSSGVGTCYYAAYAP